MLSGVWNENETSFSNYSTAAYDKAPLFDRLTEDGFQLNLYEDGLVWQSEKKSIVDNLEPCEAKMEDKDTSFMWRKWVLFKYLPSSLKPSSAIENFDLNPNCSTGSGTIFSEDNKTLYNLFDANDLQLTKDNIFHFIHAEGAHIPFNYDKNLNKIEDGTYEQKLASSITLLKVWLQRLKDFGVYDNSVIIVLSDHGYNEENYKNSSSYNHYGRQNPALLIKGINEHHSVMKNSTLPISFIDLNQAYEELLNNKKATELFSGIPLDRKRRYFYYDFLDDAHMIEYEQTGKAWENETMVPTGKEYNL